MLTVSGIRLRLEVAAAAALLVSTPANPAPTVGEGALAECGLDWAAARQGLGQLKTFGTDTRVDPKDRNHSEVSTKFDASAMRPFGFRAVAMEYLQTRDALPWLNGKAMVTNRLMTTLSGTYPQIRQKILASFGRTACVRTNNFPGEQECLVRERKAPSDGTAFVWINQRKNGAELACIY